MKKPHYIYIVIIGILLVGAAFYGGMQYQNMSSGSNSNFRRGQGLTGANSNSRAGGNFTTGQIVSSDAQSLTVQLANGSTKIVFYTDKTPMAKQTPATVADLKTGETVMIGTTTNPDGSVTARTIQIGQILAAGRPGGAPGTPAPANGNPATATAPGANNTQPAGQNTAPANAQINAGSPATGNAGAPGNMPPPPGA